MNRPASAASSGAHTLRAAGIGLEAVTLAWNVVGVVVIVFLAIEGASVALAGFGLDSLIEIAASTVVIWELTGTGEARQRFALRLIGWAFLTLAAYLLVQSGLALAVSHRPTPGVGGIWWTAATAVVMFALALGKWRVGRALGNPVLLTEGRGHDDRRRLGLRGAPRPGAGLRARLVVGRPAGRTRHRVLRNQGSRRHLQAVGIRRDAEVFVVKRFRADYPIRPWKARPGIRMNGMLWACQPGEVCA